MKYTIYGQGEGLCASATRAYVTVLNHHVVDISVSAKQAGIQVGWPLQTAQALMPDVLVFEHPQRQTETMESVYRILWTVSPWLQTVSMDSFFLQVPGDHPPLFEVRQLLMNLNSQLHTEQRFRVGFAENPFLAKALVRWSRIERIQGAMYVRVRNQQLILSPSMARDIQRSDGQPSGNLGWVAQMPIQALWFLSSAQCAELQKLGITRLGDLSRVSDSLLRAHFGKESWLWRQTLEQTSGGQVQVNYPKLERRMSWRAPIGEGASLTLLDKLLDTMATDLCGELQRQSAGALGLGIQWRTEVAKGTYEQVAKQPVYQPLALLAQLYEGRQEIVGERIEAVDLYVYDLRPLKSVQSTFLLHEDVFYPIAPVSRTQLKDVREQLMRKFPANLQIGMKPSFREQRLAAIQRGQLS